MNTVIVTGASGNLGQAMCKRFLEAGAHVIGTATNDIVLPFSSEKKFERYVVDLRKEEAAEHFVELVQKKYGAIDAAVLTVGGFAGGKLEDTDVAALEQQLQLNFITTYTVARPLFAAMMKQGHGKIFLTASRAGSEMRFGTSTLAYSLSKSLVFRLAEWMNEEAKGTAVATHVIVPSTIDTPENRKAMPSADFNSWVQPADIASIVYDYCQPPYSSIREAVIRVYNKA